MSDIVSHDPRFGKLVIGHAKLEKLWTGGRWLEGPAYFPAGRYLLFSDIPSNRIMRFDETSGVVSVFRDPSANANGNTTDRSGRLVSCEHLTRRVTRTEFDGSVRVLCDRFDSYQELLTFPARDGGGAAKHLEERLKPHGEARRTP